MATTVHKRTVPALPEGQRHRTRVLLALACSTPLALGTTPALAAEPDPGSGKVVFGMGEVGLRFEPGELAGAELRLILYGGLFGPLSPREVEARVVSGPGDSIEGDGAIDLGGEVTYGVLDLRAIAERFRGRRVQLSIWQQARGTRFSLGLSWLTGDIAAWLDQGDSSRVYTLGSLQLQPSGRATDDGWEEWVTGPVDLWLGGRLAPATLTFYDLATAGIQEGVATYNPDVRARFDALSITDLGPAAVPESTCTFVDREQACGPVGTCLYGQCVDAAPVLGPAIASEALRRDYLARIALAFTKFEGGRAPLAKADSLRAALAALDGETSPRRFREGLAIAIQDLGDGHSSPPFTSYFLPPGVGVCAYLGDADLLPSAERAELPIVADLAASSPLASTLAAGDVLVGIDGLPPRDYSVLARARLGYGGDPAGREPVEVASLIDAAFAAGSVLSFSRCVVDTSTSSSACTADQVVRFDVELAELAESFWTEGLPEWALETHTCDFRFRRAVEGSGSRDYAFAGSTDEDGVRILQINGVPAREWDGGARWFAAVDAALSDGPREVILDQRLGQGGSPDAVDQVAAYFLGVEQLYGMFLYPRIDGELTADVHERFRSCTEGGQWILGSCGDFSFWPLGFGQHPNVGLLRRSRLAILNGLDVSGNDFLPKMLTFRDPGETRFFGAAPTYGAFGAIVYLPPLLGDVFGGSFQIHDTVFARSADETEWTFTTSTGVPPDERLVQRQSDTVRGVDTVLERAKEWVRQ